MIRQSFTLYTTFKLYNFEISKTLHFWLKINHSDCIQWETLTAHLLPTKLWTNCGLITFLCDVLNALSTFGLITLFTVVVLKSNSTYQWSLPFELLPSERSLGAVVILYRATRLEGQVTSSPSHRGWLLFGKVAVSESTLTTLTMMQCVVEQNVIHVASPSKVKPLSLLPLRRNKMDPVNRKQSLHYFRQESHKL